MHVVRSDAAPGAPRRMRTAVAGLVIAVMLLLMAFRGEGIAAPTKEDPRPPRPVPAAVPTSPPPPDRRPERTDAGSAGGSPGDRYEAALRAGGHPHAASEARRGPEDAPLAR